MDKQDLQFEVSRLKAENSQLRISLDNLQCYSTALLAEITDQDSGWFYQCQNKAQQARILLNKIGA